MPLSYKPEYWFTNEFVLHFEQSSLHVSPKQIPIVDKRLSRNLVAFYIMMNCPFTQNW